MKKLIMIRHAKSSWDLPVPDQDRVITSNGIVKALKVANKTFALISTPATLWCSSSKRTRLTAKLFLETWNLDTNKIVFLDE